MLLLVNVSSNPLFLPLLEGNLKAAFSECFRESTGIAFLLGYITRRLAFWRMPAAIPYFWCLWGLMYSIISPCFLKDARSNSLFVMPLRSHVWYHSTFLFEGGPQQFLMFYAFEGSCIVSFHLAFWRRPAAIPYVWCLWGLMYSIISPCFLKEARSNCLFVMPLRAHV